MVSKNAVGNSLLFAGPDGIGKSLFASELAKLLVGIDMPAFPSSASQIERGIHPDVRVYKPEGKIGLHSIATMRQFSEEVYMTPYQSKWKVFIIHDADRMLPSSANALLKTFEEPAWDSVIILLSSNPATLLPTVISRCRTLHFHVIAEEEISCLLEKKWGCEPELAKKLAFFSHGSVGKALSLLREGENVIRQTMSKFLSQGKFSGYQDLSAAAHELSKSVEESKDAIDKAFRSENARYIDNMNAAQKESLEKEIDGAIAMRQLSIMHALFDDILGWYRDLHLLLVNGNVNYLYHRDSLDILRQTLQKGNIPSLEFIQKSIAEAKLSLERSTTLSICIENLFLKLVLC
jgi:DNA polymerase-3 subunit delta'